jgi:hypothetical protein
MGAELGYTLVLIFGNASTTGLSHMSLKIRWKRVV